MTHMQKVTVYYELVYSIVFVKKFIMYILNIFLSALGLAWQGYSTKKNTELELLRHIDMLSTVGKEMWNVSCN